MTPTEAEKLFNEHARSIHAAVYRLTLDAAAADDATQETFVRLLQSPPPVTDNIAAWLKRVAVNFAIDVLYTLFYKGGFYAILVLAAVTNALGERLSFLQLNLLSGVPWPVGLVVFWVAGDFVTYWWHRFQHANRFLWAFHSVHHSQEEMTLFAASRRHPLEELSMDVLLYFVIFHMLLGVPTRGWMPLGVFITCLAAVQHAQVDWRFGPFYKIIVSPRFHSYHHSVEARHANANYAFLFSFWDYLFGTAVLAAGLTQLPALYELTIGSAERKASSFSFLARSLVFRRFLLELLLGEALLLCEAGAADRIAAAIDGLFAPRLGPEAGRNLEWLVFLDLGHGFRIRFHRRRIGCRSFIARGLVRVLSQGRSSRESDQKHQHPATHSVSPYKVRLRAATLAQVNSTS